MRAGSAGQVRIRAFEGRDRPAIAALAGRLTIGVASWRDTDGCRTAVQQWVAASMERDASDGALYVAEMDGLEVAGFISVESTAHFSGEPGAYIGELVVDVDYEGMGIGRSLIEAAEEWTSARGYRTLTLVTGAANQGARRFYERLGFLEEEIRLTKILRDR